MQKGDSTDFCRFRKFDGFA